MTLLVSTIPAPCMLVNAQGLLEAFNAPLQSLIDERQPNARPAAYSVFDLEPELSEDEWRRRYWSIVNGTARRFTLSWDLFGRRRRSLVSIAEPNSGVEAASGAASSIWFFLQDVSDLQRELDELKVKERQFKAFFHSSDFDLNLKDRDGRYLMVSRRFEDTFGLAPGEALGKLPQEIFPADFADHVRRHDLSVMHAGTLSSQEDEVPNCELGTTLLINKFPIYTPDGELDGIGVIGTDITAQKKVQRDLRAGNDRFQTFASLAADFFWETDEHLKLNFLSDGFSLLTGHAGDKLLGRSFAEMLVTGRVNPRLIATQVDALLQRQELELFELEFGHAEGHRLTLSCRGLPYFADDGRFLGYRGVVSDVSEEKKLSDELRYQANYDELTGLLNRRAFEMAMDDLLATPVAENKIFSHFLMYLDLDKFKVINDSCGHEAGDLLLIKISDQLREAIRNGDVLARLGGDEFAALLVDCDERQALDAAQRLRAALDAMPFVYDNRPFSVSASIGLVSLSPAVGGDDERASALRRADMACFAAKDAGRNQVHLYRETDQDLAERRSDTQWTTVINGALEDDRLRLVGQPILASQGGDRPQALELLLRICDQNDKLIAPAKFLPAAERFGLTGKLDDWVIEQTLRRLQDPDDELNEYRQIMINLSDRSVDNIKMLRGIYDRLAGQREVAAKLCFEITEAAMIASSQQASEALQRLRRLGCQIALDDFGNGLSSFAYLRKFTVDVIKIDGQFVRDMHCDPRNRAMVEAMVCVSKAYGLRTVAEHVEEPAVRRALRDIGVDFVQGYSIGEPLLLR